MTQLKEACKNLVFFLMTTQGKKNKTQLGMADHRPQIQQQPLITKFQFMKQGHLESIYFWHTSNIAAKSQATLTVWYFPIIIYFLF